MDCSSRIVVFAKRELFEFIHDTSCAVQQRPATTILQHLQGDRIGKEKLDGIAGFDHST